MVVFVISGVPNNWLVIIGVFIGQCGRLWDGFYCHATNIGFLKNVNFHLIAVFYSSNISGSFHQHGSWWPPLHDRERSEREGERFQTQKPKI